MLSGRMADLFLVRQYLDAERGGRARRLSASALVPPLRRVTWKPCRRIIPSRFPPIQLFERVADPADLDAVFAVEALTNTRIREELGELELLVPTDRVSGSGSSWIMAPFTHVSTPGGRFSTAAFDAHYASRKLGAASVRRCFALQSSQTAVRRSTSRTWGTVLRSPTCTRSAS
jgi:hypothetical protein